MVWDYKHINKVRSSQLGENRQLLFTSVVVGDEITYYQGPVGLNLTINFLRPAPVFYSGPAY